MTLPIPCHGGLAEPVDRTVPEAEREAFAAACGSLPKIVVTAGDLSTLYRIGDGGLSPLTGPMTKSVFDRVLAEEVIEVGGKKYAWTIPLAFPITDDEAASLRVGSAAALVDESGTLVGRLTVEDLYDFDRDGYLKSVYQTERHDHPGARIVTEDPRTKLTGGSAEVLPAPKHPEYGDVVLSPREVRTLLAGKGWDRAVAFQTRNPLHRAHEYALIYGLEKLVGDGHNAGAVLNPLIGQTKSDDVDAATRMRTYRALVESGSFGEGDIDTELWAGKPFTFAERILLLGLDIKMFYAGPNEAVMHGIYRQNFGFSDIVIGRKHADAPFDDRTDIWEPLAAQEKFDSLAGELLIQPVKVGFAAFFEELGRVGLVDEYKPKGYHAVSISGRELRAQLQAGEMPDPRIMRRETAEILVAAMSGKG